MNCNINKMSCEEFTTFCKKIDFFAESTKFEETLEKLKIKLAIYEAKNKTV
jgi:hypothetical protein